MEQSKPIIRARQLLKQFVYGNPVTQAGMRTGRKVEKVGRQVRDFVDPGYTNPDRLADWQSKMQVYKDEGREFEARQREKGKQEPTPIPTPTPTPNVLPQANKVASKYGDMIAKYFPEEEVGNAINVMFGESSGNPKATNKNSNGSTDYGWFQINDIHAPVIKQVFGYSMQDMLDPEKNLEVASWLFKNQGWTPWVAARSLGLVN